MSWQLGLERFVESSASSSETSPQSAIESVSPIPLANPELLRALSPSYSSRISTPWHLGCIQ